jgi:hypothetical protein
MAWVEESTQRDFPDGTDGFTIDAPEALEKARRPRLHLADASGDRIHRHESTVSIQSEGDVHDIFVD